MRRRGRLPLALAAVLATSGCLGGFRSWHQLAADARSVPVPTGLTFVKEVRSVADGPGFTTSKFEEVVRQFHNTIPCLALELSWSATLRAAHRQFRVDNHPHTFGSIGSLGIMLTDRPEHLGITIGADNGYCRAPFVYAFNPPH
jgi:hypothetical protein